MPMHHPYMSVTRRFLRRRIITIRCPSCDFTAPAKDWVSAIAVLNRHAIDTREIRPVPQGDNGTIPPGTRVRYTGVTDGTTGTVVAVNDGWHDVHWDDGIDDTHQVTDLTVL